MSGVGDRETLVQARAEAAGRLAELEASFDEIVAASRDTNADDEHDPEGSTIAFERAQVVALRRQAAAHLGEVDAALARLSAGTYGVCERCGAAIAPGRLEARPFARTCIDCARQSPS